MQAGWSACALSRVHRLMTTSPCSASARAAGARVSSCNQPRQELPGAPEAGEAGEKPGDEKKQAIPSVLPPSTPAGAGRLLGKDRATRGERRPPALPWESPEGAVTHRPGWR